MRTRVTTTKYWHGGEFQIEYLRENPHIDDEWVVWGATNDLQKAIDAAADLSERDFDAVLRVEVVWDSKPPTRGET